MYFSGAHGSLEVDGIRAAKVTNWQLAATSPQLDVTALGDTDAVITPGIRATTGSCTLFYYEAANGNLNEASKLLNKILKERTDSIEPGQASPSEVVTFSLVINDGTAQGKRVKLSAYIVSATLGMSVNSITSADVTFSAIGAPVEVTVNDDSSWLWRHC